jgi:type III pantothenate kinase
MNPEILSVSSYFNASILSEKTNVPIINKYKTPNTLGKDRLAAVVGASFLFPKKDILIFDAGTCLTIDFVNARKEYLGGRISPGIEMRYKALNTFTDKLPLVQQAKISTIIGDDTNSSIVSGVQQGVLAEVKSIISDYKSQNFDIITVVTGGDCFFFEKELKNSIFANPHLVLVGLNEILDYNE